MRIFKNFVGLAAITMILFSCRKESSLEDKKPPQIINSVWEFTEGGVLYSGNTDSASVTATGDVRTIGITGNTEDARGQISLQVISTGIAPGTYSGLQVLFQYIEDGAVLFESTSLHDFSITITSVDSGAVSGTFSGTVQDAAGGLQVISDGKFTAILQETVTPVLTGDYFPLKDYWTYGNTANAYDTIGIFSGGDTTIEGKVYTRFVNDFTDEVKYYRKKDGLYYQYLISAFGIDLDTPVELVILNQNAAVNEYWESAPYDIDFSSSGSTLKITAKIKSRITQAGFSEEFNGRTYNDLIEVQSELFVENPDGSYTDAESGYRTVFAKDIGIVFYQDLDTNTSWGIRNYIIR